MDRRALEEYLVGGGGGAVPTRAATSTAERPAPALRPGFGVHQPKTKQITYRTRTGGTLSASDFNAQHPRGFHGMFARKAQQAQPARQQAAAKPESPTGALGRLGFSGPHALADFQRSRGLPPNGRLDAQTAQALKNADDFHKALNPAKVSKAVGHGGATHARAAAHSANSAPPGIYARQGMTGPKVQAVKRLLDVLGFDLGTAGLNAKYDHATAEAVRLFQAEAGLPPTGTMDDASWAAITQVFASRAAARFGLADGKPQSAAQAMGQAPTFVRAAAEEESMAVDPRVEVVEGIFGRVFHGAFDEAKHPRDHGKFAPKGGGLPAPGRGGDRPGSYSVRKPLPPIGGEVHVPADITAGEHSTEKLIEIASKLPDSHPRKAELKHEIHLRLTGKVRRRTKAEQEARINRGAGIHYGDTRGAAMRFSNAMERASGGTALYTHDMMSAHKGLRHAADEDDRVEAVERILRESVGTMASMFDPSKHPRDRAGKFSHLLGLLQEHAPHGGMAAMDRSSLEQGRGTHAHLARALGIARDLRTGGNASGGAAIERAVHAVAPDTDPSYNPYDNLAVSAHALGIQRVGGEHVMSVAGWGDFGISNADLKRLHGTLGKHASASGSKGIFARRAQRSIEQIMARPGRMQARRDLVASGARLGRRVEEATFSQKQRDKLADDDKALPDGSFPIRNTDDLENAIQAFGRAKDKARAKAWIISRAKALNATGMLPGAWDVEESAFDVEEAAVEDLAEAVDAAPLAWSDLGDDLAGRVEIIEANIFRARGWAPYPTSFHWDPESHPRGPDGKFAAVGEFKALLGKMDNPKHPHDEITMHPSGVKIRPHWRGGVIVRAPGGQRIRFGRAADASTVALAWHDRELRKQGLLTPTRLHPSPQKVQVLPKLDSGHKPAPAFKPGSTFRPAQGFRMQGEHMPAALPKMAPSMLTEAVLGLMEGVFAERLHPRDREGKFARIAGGLRKLGAVSHGLMDDSVSPQHEALARRFESGEVGHGELDLAKKLASQHPNPGPRPAFKRAKNADNSGYSRWTDANDRHEAAQQVLSDVSASRSLMVHPAQMEIGDRGEHDLASRMNRNVDAQRTYDFARSHVQRYRADKRNLTLTIPLDDQEAHDFASWYAEHYPGDTEASTDTMKDRFEDWNLSTARDKQEERRNVTTPPSPRGHGRRSYR